MVYNWLSLSFIPLAIPYSLSFLVLLIGSITDLRTREVPDWVNYGFIMSGVCLNLLFSVIYSTPSFVIASLIGLAIFFAIAYLMFYAGQWGGGDSKILMGIGATIGINVSSKEQFLLAFFINALFAGAIYGMLWSVFLAFKNKKKFFREFIGLLSRKNIVRAKRILLSCLIIIIAVVFFVQAYYIRLILLSLAFLALVTFYLWVFVRAIEKSSMYKLVEPSKLTEGDWIVKDIYVGKEYICGPKDLGIEKKQIKRLVELYKKGKVKKILMKEGIPFVPTFLIAFIVTFIIGNPFIWFL